MRTNPWLVCSHCGTSNPGGVSANRAGTPAHCRTCGHRGKPVELDSREEMRAYQASHKSKLRPRGSVGAAAKRAADADEAASGVSPDPDSE